MTLDWRRRRRKLVMAPYAIYSHVELSARNLITSITYRSTKNPPRLENKTTGDALETATIRMLYIC